MLEKANLEEGGPWAAGPPLVHGGGWRRTTTHCDLSTPNALTGGQWDRVGTTAGNLCTGKWNAAKVGAVPACATNWLVPSMPAWQPAMESCRG